MPASTSGSMIVQIELNSTAGVLRDLALDQRRDTVEPALALTRRDQATEVGALVGGPAHVDRGEDREQREGRGAVDRDELPADAPPEQQRRGDRVRGHHREHTTDVGTEERRAVDDDRDAEQRDRDERAPAATDAIREQSREQERARRELRVGEVAEPRVPTRDRRRVPEHGVELQPRAGRDVDEDQPDEDAQRDDQRHDARPIGREPRDQRDHGADPEEEQPVRRRAVVGRTATNPARNVAARNPISVSAASSIAIERAPSEAHERDQRAERQQDLEHDEPHRDLGDLAVAELRRRWCRSATSRRSAKLAARSGRT